MSRVSRRRPEPDHAVRIDPVVACQAATHIEAVVTRQFAPAYSIRAKGEPGRTSWTSPLQRMSPRSALRDAVLIDPTIVCQDGCMGFQCLAQSMPSKGTNACNMGAMLANTADARLMSFPGEYGFLFIGIHLLAHLWLDLIVKFSSRFVVFPSSNFCWQLDFFFASFV
jgi:hypothetical protein